MSDANGKFNGALAKRRPTVDDIALRRKQVLAMRIQGIPIAKMALGLHVTPATIKSDLKWLRETNKERISQFQSDSFVAEALDKLELIEERAWLVHSRADEGSAAQIKALDLVRKIQLDKVAALIDVGIISKKEEPTQVEHTHKLTLDLPPQARQMAARALLEQTLRGTLAEPVPDGEPEPDNIIEGEVVGESTDATGTDDS